VAAEFAAQIASGHARPCLFAELAFSGGTVRACSWNHNIAWGGYTWLGAGMVSSAGEIEEAAEIRAYGFSLSLSGVPAANISAALNEYYQGRRARLWFGLLSEAHAVDGTPYGPFVYRMNTMDGTLGRNNVLQLTLESRIADLARAKIRRWTLEDQQIDFPGDTYGRHLPEMAGKELY
jgi:hypothetical protein